MSGTSSAACPAETELWARAEDGWRLSVLRQAPPVPVRGAVLLGHAMMANRRSLDRPAGLGLASTLRAAGLVTYLLDCRGHGRSGPTPAQGGDWNYDDVVLRDLPAALALVREVEGPSVPLAVAGHSLTGHGTLALLGQRPELCGQAVAAVVSLASNVWMPALEADRTRWRKKWLALLGFGLATRPVGYFPARRLGMGSEDVSRGFVEMFQHLRRTGRWQSVDERLDYLEGLPRVRVPVLAVVGRGDRLLCHPDSSVAFHRRLSGARVQHWTVGRGTFGLAYDPDHMQIVTDARSRPLWQAVARWLLETREQRAAVPASSSLGQAGAAAGSQPSEPGFSELGRKPG